MPLGLEALPLAIMSWGIEAMRTTAAWVASLPGAVTRVSAISDIAFGLMIAGGLWLVLWETRWRLLGLAGLAAGVVCTPWHRSPDVLAGEGGRIVAVRGASGDLEIWPSARPISRSRNGSNTTATSEKQKPRAPARPFHATMQAAR